MVIQHRIAAHQSRNDGVFAVLIKSSMDLQQHLTAQSRDLRDLYVTKRQYGMNLMAWSNTTSRRTANEFLHDYALKIKGNSSWSQ